MPVQKMWPAARIDRDAVGALPRRGRRSRAGWDPPRPRSSRARDVEIEDRRHPRGGGAAAATAPRRAAAPARVHPSRAATPPAFIPAAPPRPPAFIPAAPPRPPAFIPAAPPAARAAARACAPRRRLLKRHRPRRHRRLRRFPRRPQRRRHRCLRRHLHNHSLRARKPQRRDGWWPWAPPGQAKSLSPVSVESARILQFFAATTPHRFRPTSRAGGPRCPCAGRRRGGELRRRRARPERRARTGRGSRRG